MVDTDNPKAKHTSLAVAWDSYLVFSLMNLILKNCYS